MSTTRSRANLLTLPDELLLVILNYASPLLYGATLANRRLHALSKPFLYSVFSYDTWVPDLFLRTICRSQDLARQVKEIVLRYNIQKAEDLSLAPERVARYQQLRLDVLGDTLVEMGARGNKLADWIQQKLIPGRRYMGDLRGLYLLLLFTPNVERLKIHETFKWDRSVYWFMPLVESHTDALSRLTSVTLHGPMRLQNIVPLMTVPSMRHLELTEVTEMVRERNIQPEWHSRSWHAMLDESGSNIEHLYLYSSFINLRDITIAIKSIRGLKTFVYEHVSPGWDLAYYAPLEVDMLGELVESQADTLTTLRISDKSYYAPEFVETTATNEIIKSLCNVIDLELTHVKLATANFRAPEWQTLPASLKDLSLDFVEMHLYDANKDFTDLEMCLEMLVARKVQGDLPNLQTLTLKQWNPWYGCVPTNVRYVKDLLQNAGIKFSSIPEEIGLRFIGDEDIGWVELHTEPEWVFVERVVCG